jgi:hypothetical protein
MSSQYQLHHLRSVAPALVALIVAACATTAPDAQVEADDTEGGLPTKPLDGGVETKDSGLGTKDSGLGIKDSGLGTKDSGLETDDAGAGTDDGGPVTEDSGPGTEDSGAGTSDSGTRAGDAGMSPPDAGAMGECFACAEQRCGNVATACVRSPACVQEGECDLACLALQGPLPLLGRLCFESCTRDLRANQELIAAVTCAFALCPKECLDVPRLPPKP